MGSTAVESVKTLLQVDRSNYDGFEKDRIVAQNFAWDATIPQTKLPLMSYSSKPAKQKTEKLFWSRDDLNIYRCC